MAKFAPLGIVAVASITVSGCGAERTQPPVVAATTAASPESATATGAGLGGLLGGPLGAALSEADRAAAWKAQVAALNSGQHQSWRGAHGVFGFVEVGNDTGGGCRAYNQTIYLAGRPHRGHGIACQQPDGSWRMSS